MPRVYVKKGTRLWEIDEVAMQSAIKKVLDKTFSIKKSVEKYSVKPTTLESHEATVYISDMVCIFPEPKSVSTARIANMLNSFQKDLSMYNVQ
ncbi:unnamed protein product [Euphydryas editha]|uniref:Uncharacterized protein n=1 Tax=Euphydryas editha TaxID=104508 RepID=A0AAU9UTI5_EUPED|nr:unnamed protein product [Euphydryas editha]